MSVTVDALLDLPTLVTVASTLAAQAELSTEESAMAARYQTQLPKGLMSLVTEAILSGTDPLGTAYCAIKSPEERRGAGQTFTPIEAVLGMFAWAEARGRIARIVDPGAGSGRYILTGLRRNPGAVGVASEMDPLVALLLRANAHALGLQDRLQICLGDFRTLELERIEGRTLFIGNPPYVRHHDISPAWKEWYSEALKARGHAASQLAGLHLHFFLKALQLSRMGDLGCFITAAEWLDVNYGQSLRDMMTNGLGGKAVFVVSPTIPVFGDAMVSACIACFEPGTDAADIEFKKIESVEQLLELNGGHFADKVKAKAQRSWSVLLRNREVEPREGFISLGDLFKVSRGIVTGQNDVWVSGSNRFGLPDEFMVPSITEASDIVRAKNSVIDTVDQLRRVISLPADLGALRGDDKRAVEEFLRWARASGADQSYTARQRKPWWSLPVKVAPQIVVTYMGRRPPVFAINRARASLINVAHGLYPKVPLNDVSVVKLVAWLNGNVSQDSGRVYAGGLTKFEPGEVMRLQVPSPAMLEEGHV